MELELPNGESHTIERKRAAESFRIEVTFYDTDDDMYSLKAPLSKYTDASTHSRSDITTDVVREAALNFAEAVFDRDDVDVDEIHAIEIISQQALRKTPYSDREYRND